MTQYIYEVNHKSGTFSFGPEMYIGKKLKTKNKSKQTAGVILVDTANTRVRKNKAKNTAPILT